MLECGRALRCVLARHGYNLARADPQLREMLLLHVLRAGMCQAVLLVHPGLVNSLILSTPRLSFLHYSIPLPCTAAGETCSCPRSPFRAAGIAKASLAVVPNG